MNKLLPKINEQFWGNEKSKTPTKNRAINSEDISLDDADAEDEGKTRVEQMMRCGLHWEAPRYYDY